MTLVVALLVGITGVQGWGPFARPPRPRVVVLGDSLTAQSSWAITEELVAGGYDAAVSGVNGAAIDDAEPMVRTYTGYSGAAIVVAALGTNNAFYAAPGAPRRVSPEETKADLRAFTEAALVAPPNPPFPHSVRCLVWVTVNDRAALLELDEHAPAVNQAIRDETDLRRREGHQMVIADWTSRSQGHPEWFVRDGIHLTDAGQHAYAALIAETIARCRL